MRAWKQPSGGTKTYYLYDGSDPVCEMNSSGAVTFVNTFGVNGLLSRRDVSASTSTFYTFDERGNVAQRFNAAGAVLSSDLYDSFGARTSTAAQSDPWGFGAQAGYYTDAETGLSLLTNRYYDPQAGRFLTRDPIGYDGGINLYSYTANDPINNLDPSGLDDGDDVLSERETETAGMFSLRDPVSQQAGLNTAADLLRAVPVLGAVYAGATALSGCDAVTLHSESGGQRAWDGAQVLGLGKLFDEGSAIQLSFKFPAMQKHHIFPQEFRQEFKNIGLHNIDDFTVAMRIPEHNALRIEWNDRWRDFLRTSPDIDQVWAFARQMMQEFKLEGRPWLKYP